MCFWLSTIKKFKFSVITYFVLKVCEAARINYEEVLKVVKQACKCSTKLCPNWECTCEADSVTGELEEECTCLTCGCDDCSNCQVNNIYWLFV